jgi:hypothetical protein
MTATHPYVLKAADALRAAEAATDPEERDAFRALAEFYIQTIQCNGNEHSARLIMRRREARARSET